VIRSKRRATTSRADFLFAVGSAFDDGLDAALKSPIARCKHRPNGMRHFHHMEFNRKIELRKPWLVFFIHKDHPVVGDDIEGGASALWNRRIHPAGLQGMDAGRAPAAPSTLTREAKLIAKIGGKRDSVSCVRRLKLRQPVEAAQTVELLLRQADISGDARDVAVLRSSLRPVFEMIEDGPR
jgi:hypothetical protein